MYTCAHAYAAFPAFFNSLKILERNLQYRFVKESHWTVQREIVPRCLGRAILAEFKI